MARRRSSHAFARGTVVAADAVGAASRPPVAPPPAQVRPPEKLYRVRVRDIWRYIQTQPRSYWLVCIFLFLEYVRPQSIYPQIAIVPWSLLTVILAMIAMLSEKRRKRKWTVLDTGMVAFTATVVLSSLTAWDPSISFSYDRLSLYYVWLLVYILISSVVTNEKRFLVFMLSFLLYNLKMSQHAAGNWVMGGFAFDQWAAVGAPGWFHNPGEMGIEMVIFLPIAFAFYLGLKPHWPKLKQWFFLALPATAIAAAAASSSRGAQLALAAVAFWVLLKSKYKVRGTIVAVVLGVLVYLILPQEQRERFESMGDDKTSQARLTAWKDGIAVAGERPLFGIGYGNWIRYYRSERNPKGIMQHNVFVEAGSEMGYTGFGAFLFLIGGTLVLNHKTRRMARRLGAEGRFLYFMGHGLDGALIGFLAGGFFVTVLFYPFFWVNLGMTGAAYEATRVKARTLASIAPVRAPA